MKDAADGFNGFPLRDFGVTVERSGDATRIAVTGEVDLATVGELQAAIADIVDQASVDVDLTRVTYIDSTGIRVLLEAHDRLADRLHVIPSAACLRVFDIVGVTPLLR